MENGMKIGVVLFIIGLFLAFTVTDTGKNLSGHVLGFGACPHCGDSWFWKESGSVPFRTLVEGEDYELEGNEDGKFDIRVTSGFMVCQECLDNYNELDELKIEQELVKSGWSIEEAAEAREAVEKYKVNARQELIDQSI